MGIIDLIDTTTDEVIGGDAMEISSDVIRGFSDMMILSILRDGPNYGYEISKQIRFRSAHQFVMKETTLYSAFKRLENNGHVVAFAGEETAGKKRTYYRITQKGERYFREKCIEWDLTKEVLEKFVR